MTYLGTRPILQDELRQYELHDVSLYYGEKLYPLIAKVEMVVRQIIYLFMLKNVGSKWSKEQSPDDVKKAILNTVGKNQPEGITYPDTDVLVYADFITLGYFFFSKYSLKSNYQELVSELKKKENYTEEKIKDLIELYESKSNWDSQNRSSANDNRLMIYFQGMKVYIPDNFQPDTLLKLLQTLKKL